jgi:hypothetical protein
MNVYILTRIDLDFYGEILSMVIVAETPGKARKMACDYWNENTPRTWYPVGDFWKDPEQVSCKKVNENKPAVVLTAYKGD